MSEKENGDSIDTPIGNLKSEFGCIEQVNFPNSEDVTAYDQEGNEIFCKCGNKAGIAFIGRESSIDICTECYSKLCAEEFGEKIKMVYRKPDKNQIRKLPDYFDDTFLVSISKKDEDDE